MATDAPTKQMIHAAKLVAVTISFTCVVESLCLLRYRDRQEVCSVAFGLVGSCSVAFGLVGGFTSIRCSSVVPHMEIMRVLF